MSACLNQGRNRWGGHSGSRVKDPKPNARREGLQNTGAVRSWASHLPLETSSLGNEATQTQAPWGPRPATLRMKQGNVSFAWIHPSLAALLSNVSPVLPVQGRHLPGRLSDCSVSFVTLLGSRRVATE